MVIDGVWKGQLGEGEQGIVGLCFSLPFIVLSGYAGQFADRHSKRDVIMVKLIEIPITVVALIGFSMGNLWITLASLVALTSQSAYFGPARYGMIPEIVVDGELSRANGTINMMTNVAAIVGTLAAGMISDRYSPNAQLGGAVVEPLRWLPGGLGASRGGRCRFGFGAVSQQAGTRDDCALKYDLNPLSTYAISVRKMAKSHLLMVALAWGYFYLLAGLALLIVPEYSIILSKSHASTSGLLGVLAVAIGGGSLAAGLTSGHQIRPRLIPLGALGMAVFFVLLGVLPQTYSSVAAGSRHSGRALVHLECPGSRTAFARGSAEADSSSRPSAPDEPPIRPQISQGNSAVRGHADELDRHSKRPFAGHLRYTPARLHRPAILCTMSVPSPDSGPVPGRLGPRSGTGIRRELFIPLSVREPSIRQNRGLLGTRQKTYSRNAK